MEKTISESNRPADQKKKRCIQKFKKAEWKGVKGSDDDDDENKKDRNEEN